MKKWSIAGADVITPDEILRNASLTIAGDKIEKVGQPDNKVPLIIHAENSVLSPGLINAHDHLLGTYYPKVGNGPYENWLPWDNDLKSAPVYQERQQIENRDLYLLGAYRNLLSGVTTVSDHIPHFVNEPFLDILPVRVIREYALVHSIASFALNWGEGVEEEYKKAAKKDIPFITHIAEGFDSETKNDLKVLEKKNGLGEHSVLVHGIAFSEEDIDKIKKKNASVVWCADSNIFMFNKTANVRYMLEKGVNVCIGTDSPMSGGLNLLYEMKFDKSYYQRTYGKELSDEQIVKMVTVNPARAFRMHRHGRIKSGFIADFTLFSKKGDPYTSIVKAELPDVKLVVIAGKAMYGNAEFEEVFVAQKTQYQKVVLDGIEKVVSGDLKGLLKRISKAVGFKKEFPFMPIEFNYP